MVILRPPPSNPTPSSSSAALSPDVPFPPLRATGSFFEQRFSFQCSEIEIQVPRSTRKPKVVVVVAAVLSGVFAGATLIAYKDLSKLCDAAVADQAKFGEFSESVKRRELSIQSTDGALANALN